jgi:hypothetical protein
MTCHSRVESSRVEQCRRDVLRGESILLLLAVGEEWWRLKPRPLLDLNDSALNRDRRLPIHTKVFLFRRLSLSPSVCYFFSHSHRLHRAHSTGESSSSVTSSCCWDPARDSRAIRFLGSVFTRLLALVRLLPLRRPRTTPYDYFLYVDYERTTTSTTGLHRDHMPALT